MGERETEISEMLYLGQQRQAAIGVRTQVVSPYEGWKFESMTMVESLLRSDKYAFGGTIPMLETRNQTSIATCLNPQTKLHSHMVCPALQLAAP